MGSLLPVSTTASLTYGSRHQRVWVASLSQWVAFPEPTLYGNPLTEAACDRCTAFVPRPFGDVREQGAS